MDVETPEDLREYRAYVEQMFNDKSTSLISNRNTLHAKILIETLVSTSQSSVDVLCKNLCKKVYGDAGIRSRIAAAALRGVRFRILCQNEPEASDLEPSLRALGITDDMVAFRFASKTSEAANAPYNFVVTDRSAFRFETDPNDHVATASANSTEIARKILKAFNELWIGNEVDHVQGVKVAADLA